MSLFLETEILVGVAVTKPIIFRVKSLEELLCIILFTLLKLYKHNERVESSV